MGSDDSDWRPSMKQAKALEMPEHRSEHFVSEVTCSSTLAGAALGGLDHSRAEDLSREGFARA